MATEPRVPQKGIGHPALVVSAGASNPLLLVSVEPVGVAVSPIPSCGREQTAAVVGPLHLIGSRSVSFLEIAHARLAY